MAERRSRSDIIFDILALIQRKGVKVKPTHILYGANLSHDRLKKYLDELEGKGLIEHFEETKKKKTKTYYKLTEKGFNLLNELRKMKEIEEAFGL